MDTEIWVEVKGYEGCYEASSLGRIRSIDRTVNSSAKNGRPCKGKVLKGMTTDRGYIRIGLSRGYKSKIFFAHRIIADCFIPNPNNLPFVNHKNGIKADNRIENLEWCTSSENIRHAISTGLYKVRRGENRYNSVLKEDQVLEIRALIESGVKCGPIAKKFGIVPQYVSTIKRRITWKHI